MSPTATSGGVAPWIQPHGSELQGGEQQPGWHQRSVGDRYQEQRIQPQRRPGHRLNGDNSLLDSNETSYNSWRLPRDTGGIKVIVDSPSGNRIVRHTAKHNHGPRHMVRHNRFGQHRGSFFPGRKYEGRYPVRGHDWPKLGDQQRRRRNQARIWRRSISRNLTA